VATTLRSFGAGAGSGFAQTFVGMDVMMRSRYDEVVTLVGRQEFARLRAKYGQARRSR
jgi:hypothetical protein